MKAYAILDGGGVRGAALAGCLKAAEELGIHFAGYGGTSAGSIVALLACVGFKGHELHQIMIQEIAFTDFLDDSGVALERLRKIPIRFKNSWSKLYFIFRHIDLYTRIHDNLGLYHANNLQQFILDKIKEKLPELSNKSDITFNDLKEQNCPPLKIVTSDLKTRKAIVYPDNADDCSTSVIDAVRASMSYPFVFHPIRINDALLVDGGLCSNLPTFLFEEERRRNHLPVIAFDLVSPPVIRGDNRRYGIRQFCRDMLATALEASDHLLRTVLDGVYWVSVRVPDDIGTLDFSLSKEDRERLFMQGYYDTHTFFYERAPQWRQAKNQVEQLQALHAPAYLVEPVLQALAENMQKNTPAENVRCHIMLPTDRGTRMVVYQYGMDNDPDIDLELAIDGGCSGFAWSTRQPTFADMDALKENFIEWKMSKEQRNRIPKDRKAMLSVPMFDLAEASLGLESINNLNTIGNLSIDTTTPLEDTLWLGDKQAYVVETAKTWADILSKLVN